MATHQKDNPAFRLRELMGPEFRPDYAATLAQAMHLRFDPVAQEEMPDELSGLVGLLPQR